MSSDSDNTSLDVLNARAENSSSCATSQEGLVARLDIFSSKDPSPIPAKKHNTAKKQKIDAKMSEITINDKDFDASDVSDVDNPGHVNIFKSTRVTTPHKKPASKATKSKTKAVTDVVSDEAEADENPIKKPTSASKTKLSTSKKSISKTKKDTEPINATPTVSDAEDEEPARKTAPPPKLRKKRASTPMNDGARKKAKLPASAHSPDSYETLNQEDKILFDLKTQNPKDTWREITVQFNLAIQTVPETTHTALKQRWAKVKAAGTEIEHDDIQKMCIYKQDMEKRFEKERETMLRRFADDMWKNISAYVASEGGNDYDPNVLQRKYGVYRRHGRIDEHDNFTEWTKEAEKSVAGAPGDDEDGAGADDDTEDENEVDADMKVETEEDIDMDSDGV